MNILDTYLFDTQMLGGQDGDANGVPSTLVEFGAQTGALYSLSDGETTFVRDIDDSGPDSEIIQHNIVRDDGVTVVNRYDRGKIITIVGWLKATDFSTLNIAKDTMRKKLRFINGALYITKDGLNTRKYTASLINYQTLFADHQGNMLTWCPYKATFFCTGYGVDLEYTSRTESFTISPSNKLVHNNGTAKADPIATMVFDAASSVTAVKFKNLTTGESITFTGAISTSDVLKFDCEAKEVYLNDVKKDYSGSFPELDIGNNLLEFTVTASSFDATTTIKWRNPYR